MIGGVSGYVVSRPYETSGVGSNLASLAGALWLAQRLQRTLLVDWRGQSELADKRLNYFAEFLSLPPEVAGVDVVPVLPGDERFGSDMPGARWLEPGDARALASGTAVAAEEYVILKTYHGLDRLHPGPESERFRFLRAFYRALSPNEAVRSAVDDWERLRLRAFCSAIALNVRTGNRGRDFAPGGRYSGRVDTSLFENEPAFLRLLERACGRILAHLPRELRTSCAIFVVTDNAAMRSLLTRLPNAITRREVFPPAGADHQYAFEGDGYSDRDGVIDTLVDMFLLARCDGLVYNSSLFNQYARVVTGCFGGSQVHFESLLLRKRYRYAMQRARRLVRSF